MKSPLPQSRINHPFLRRRVCRSRDTYELRREFDGVSNPRQLGYMQRLSNLLLVSQTVGTMIAAPCRPRSFWPNSRRSSWRSLRLPNISMGGHLRQNSLCCNGAIACYHFRGSLPPGRTAIWGNLKFVATVSRPKNSLRLFHCNDGLPRGNIFRSTDQTATTEITAHSG